MDEETGGSRAAQQLLDDAREELARADDKASSTLGAVSALVAGAVVAPRELGPGSAAHTWGWAGGLLVCGLGTVLLMLAALPRFTTRSRRQVLTYFGAVARARRQGDLSYLYGCLDMRSSDAIITELRVIGRVVVTKYRCIRLGMICAVAGAVLLIMSVI